MKDWKRFGKTLINKDLRKSLRKRKQKKSFNAKIKEIEKSLSALKKYYDHDDAKYIGIRDVGNLYRKEN